MHPDDVAALVAVEFGDLQQQLAERADPRIDAAELISPTKIRIPFSGRAYESALAGSGVLLPGPEGRQSAYRVPILGARPRRLLLLVDCEDWDGTPPEFDLRLPDGGELAEWPKGTTNGGVARGHPDYSRPFFCRPGTREFHSHPVHADNPWDLHREGMTLASITLGLIEDLINRWTMG